MSYVHTTREGIKLHFKSAAEYLKGLKLKEEGRHEEANAYLYRENAPPVEYPNGDKYWVVDGKLIPFGTFDTMHTRSTK